MVIAQNGGNSLARGGTSAFLEGDWRPKQVVNGEFSTLAAAMGCYESRQYRAARALRAGLAAMDVTAVQGVA